MPLLASLLAPGPFQLGLRVAVSSVVGGRLQLPWKWKALPLLGQKTGPGPPGAQVRRGGFTRVSIWGLQGLRSWI